MKLKTVILFNSKYIIISSVGRVRDKEVKVRLKTVIIREVKRERKVKK